jgi:hypothetical protein
MKSAMLILISAFLMAGCAENPGTNPRQSGPPFRVVSGFLDGDDRIIEVTVTAEKPVNRIELVSPTGQTYPAERIERSFWTATAPANRPQFGVGVFGGSSSGVGTAVGIGLPLGGETARTTLVDSRASLPISDIAAYRSNWQQWQIRIGLDNPPRQVTTPAPQPPAN